MTDSDQILDELEDRLEAKHTSNKQIVEHALDGELDLTRGERTAIAGEARGFLKALQLVRSLRSDADRDES